MKTVDLNCLLPMERLGELAQMRKIGGAAPSHYSYMGYLPEPQEMLEKSIPAIIVIEFHSIGWRNCPRQESYWLNL